MDYDLLLTDELIDFLRGFALALRHTGRDVVAEVVEVATNRLVSLSDTIDFDGSVERKFLEWLYKNVPDVEKALDDMGLTELERARIDVTIDFMKFIESEEAVSHGDA